MTRLRFIAVICLMLGMSGCRGATWPRQMLFPETTPIVFTGPPTTDDIVRVVNSNTAPIRQLHATSATVAIAGYPPLPTTIDFEKPRRFRLRAQVIGPELDLGSNDELFWLWIKRNPQPAVYYARHDQFAQSPMKRTMPIDPQWLPEAMGMVQFDPMAKYEGPFPAGQNRVQIRARVPSPDGEQTRVYIVHDQYGYITEQSVYDARGQLLASASASKHQHYKTEGVTLPQRVDIKVPSAQLSLTVNVSGYQINSLFSDPAQLWSLPKYEGYPLVDLADPNLRATPTGFASAPPNSFPPSVAPAINGVPNNMVPNYASGNAPPNANVPLNTPALGNPPPSTAAPYSTNPGTIPYTPPQSNYRLNQRGMTTTLR